MQKAYRIRKNRQFHYVYRKGKGVGAKEISLTYVRAGKLQVGFSVSKKVGNAVVRNRVRRRLREIVRLNAPRLKSGWDIVVVARSRCVHAEYRKLEAAFLRACGELGLLREVEG